MHKGVGKRLLYLSMSVGGVLVALILLELVARKMPLPYGEVDDAALVCSEQLGWRGKPGFQAAYATDGYEHVVTHNRAGMHDTEHPLSKPEQTVRLLMLGDSFGRAGHVNEVETAHQVLEDLLNHHAGARAFEVINAAVGGWGTGQQLIYYRQEGRRYEADVVILMLYIGNDFQDNLPGRARTIAGRNCYAPYFVLCADQLDPQPWPYSPGVKPASGNCSPLKKIWAILLSKLYLSSGLYTQLEPLLAPGDDRVDRLPYYPLYIPAENELFDYAWQLTLALLKQLQEEVNRDGAELVVVLINPADVLNLVQMSLAEREVIFESLPDLRRAEADLPNLRLAQALSQEQIPFLDLQPLFIQHGEQSGEALYFPIDKHWTVAGNRLAAEAIFDWLYDLDSFKRRLNH